MVMMAGMLGVQEAFYNQKRRKGVLEAIREVSGIEMDAQVFE
jgi:hypothetical protein